MQKYVNILIHSIKMGEKNNFRCSVSTMKKTKQVLSCLIVKLHICLHDNTTHVCPSVCMDIHIIKPRTQAGSFAEVFKTK